MISSSSSITDPKKKSSTIERPADELTPLHIRVIAALWHTLGCFIIQVPLVLFYTIYYRVTPSLFQGVSTVGFVILYVGYGMSVCLHRFFSHQAFRTSTAFAVVLGLLGTIANQGPVLWWASMHNRHHKFCDQPRDPHSISQCSNTIFGYMYAFIFWTLYEYNTEWEFVPRAHRDNTGLVLINTCQPILIWAWIIFLFQYVGDSWAIWGYCIPVLISTIGSMDFNLQFHPRDHEPHHHGFDEGGVVHISTSKNCKATDEATRGDEPWIPKLIGEASHHDHHVHPRRSRRPGIDISHKGMIAPLAFFGVIWGEQNKWVKEKTK